MFSPCDEPNFMGYHRNTLISSDKSRNKASNPYHTKDIRLVTPEKIVLFTPEENVCWRAQVIMTSRNQARKLGPEISRISTYHDSNIIACHRNVLLPDEGINEVSNTDPDTSFTPNNDFIHWDK